VTLPADRQERLALLLEDSTEYIRRMGSTEVDRLLKGLSKTQGLSDEEAKEIRNESYNVDPRFLPIHLREDH